MRLPTRLHAMPAAPSSLKFLGGLPSWGAPDLSGLPLIRNLREISKGFSENLEKWPLIPCPTCLRGGTCNRSRNPSWKKRGSPVNPGATMKHESPEWIQGDFLCVLTCRRESCDRVRVVGHSAVEATGNREWDGEQYEQRLTPTVFFPALPLLESRPVCPKEVGNGWISQQRSSDSTPTLLRTGSGRRRGPDGRAGDHPLQARP